jgi:homopolymeric O-antigen transport system permease protein
LNPLGAPWRTLGARRELIREMVSRELRDRHAGQMLGVLWAYGHPLALMLIYTVLFAYVFPARFGEGATAIDYSASVLAGIVPWLAFQDILGRAPSVLVGHASLVKQIVFPTEVLPIKSALASAMPYSVGVVFAVAYAAHRGTLSFMVLLVPALVVLQLMAMVGAALALSAIGLFWRDLRDIVMVFCSVNLFAQPILYNPLVAPKLLNWVFALNPFSYLTWCWQDALFHGGLHHPAAWVVFPAGSLATLAIGWAVFDRTRHHFGDAL